MAALIKHLGDRNGKRPIDLTAQLVTMRADGKWAGLAAALLHKEQLLPDMDESQRGGYWEAIRDVGDAMSDAFCARVPNVGEPDRRVDVQGIVNDTMRAGLGRLAELNAERETIFDFDAEPVRVRPSNRAYNPRFVCPDLQALQATALGGAADLRTVSAPAQGNKTSVGQTQTRSPASYRDQDGATR